MLMSASRILVAALALAAWTGAARPALACPNCSQALAQQQTDGRQGSAAARTGNLGRGLSLSVMAMLAVMGAVAFGFFRVMRRAVLEADAAHAAAAGAETVAPEAAPPPS